MALNAIEIIGNFLTNALPEDTPFICLIFADRIELIASPHSPAKLAAVLRQLADDIEQESRELRYHNVKMD